MSKEVILTGLRANNDLQIGNYFGAILPMVKMAHSRADDYQVNLMVADLHSFITPINFDELNGSIANNLRVYAAAGFPLDLDTVRIFRQSYVPAHSELTWILDCFTGMGEMGRMIQYKDKSSKLTEDRINVGLFNYPVLMAADILLYNVDYVPVGEDQTQHLEFTRDIAERLNSQFGELFTLPKPVKAQHEFFGKEQGLRIRDLVDPAKKMSKSDETGKGVIFLGDNPEHAAKKIMGATTDSVGAVHYDYQTQPGISNLLDMYALLKGEDIQSVVAQFEGQTQYGELKKAVAEQVTTFLTDFQAKYSAVDQSALQAKLIADEKAMNEIANSTLLKVQKAVGLRQ